MHMRTLASLVLKNDASVEVSTTSSLIKSVEWLSKYPHSLQAGLEAAAGQSLETMRRFEIAWVRRKALGRALPRAYLQADLDFLSSSNKTVVEAALLEAEAIKTMVEVGLQVLPK